jgi:hypothetical protein
LPLNWQAELGIVGEKTRALIHWLTALHAPLGHGAPFAASALFAVAGISPSGMWRTIAYLSAAILAILIAADITRTLVERHPYISHPRTILTLPMLAFRAVLTLILGSVYSYLVFIGIGPWTPFVLWPVLFVVCSMIAWRNVEIWYEQGAEFEEELKEADAKRALRPVSHAPDRGR